MELRLDGLISLIILFFIGLFIASKIRKETLGETISALINKIKGGEE